LVGHWRSARALTILCGGYNLTIIIGGDEVWPSTEMATSEAELWLMSCKFEAAVSVQLFKEAISHVCAWQVSEL